MRALQTLLLLSWLAASSCNQERTGIIPLEGAAEAAPPANPGMLLGSSSPSSASSEPGPNDPDAPSAPPSIVPATSCATDSDCSSPGPHCDAASGSCVECVTAAHCPEGSACTGNRCMVAVMSEPGVAPADDMVPPGDAEPVPTGSDAIDAGTEPPPQLDAGAEPPAPPVPLGEGCSTTLFDPCSDGLPMLAGPHTVDADPSDFCELPVAVLELRSAALTVGETSGLPHRADFKVAWSADALHLFARVADPNVLPESTPNTWAGDSFEVYVASTASTSGNLGDDGTPQIILAPPSADGSVAASAMRFPAQEQINSGYAAATEGSGYFVELSLPWPGGASLQAGSTVRLDFAINAREQPCTDTSDLNACRQYYGAFTYTSPGGGPCDGYTLQSGRSAEPWCDNRTWCEVTLK